ncbi:MAG: hypothetical protein BAJATHORv1_40251 [Candidatus Thorarchaeota archaeon]|nr:MAG: hypothetical protein BAJATHORv1_40251 [Candidatus Thorarchaeota archaeon]
MNEKSNDPYGSPKPLNTDNPNRPTIITVYTMKKCAFCDVAVQTLREVTKTAESSRLIPKIIESSLDRAPELMEEMSIEGIPTIILGNSRIVGLPTREDIVDLLNRELFLGLSYEE